METEKTVVVEVPSGKQRITLPCSGQVIEIDDRELRGRDREQADVIRARLNGGNTTWFHAMLSFVLSFVENGQLRPLVKEDLDDMSTRDIDAIVVRMKGDERFFEPKTEPLVK